MAEFMKLRMLAYIEETKELRVIATCVQQRLADRMRDPFANHPEVLDLEKEIEQRIASWQQWDAKKVPALQDLLHLVQQYNESHSPFERLRYIKNASHSPYDHTTSP